MEIDQLKGVLRRSYVLDATRLENTAEHSWHLAMMALVLGEHADIEADLTTVLKMLVVHDLVEIDAGDTFVHDTAGAATKDAREGAASGRRTASTPTRSGPGTPPAPMGRPRYGPTPRPSSAPPSSATTFPDRLTPGRQPIRSG